MPYWNYVSQEAGADAQAASAGYVEYGSDKINAVGSFPFRVDQNGNVSINGTRLTAPVAATPAAGFALQNGTPTILSWTAPNDGQLHRITAVPATIHVTGAETGGLVQLQWFAFPGAGSPHASQLFAAGLATDTTGQLGSLVPAIVAPGTTVSIVQASALTAGAATMWAEIWAS